MYVEVTLQLLLYIYEVGGANNVLKTLVRDHN